MEAIRPTGTDATPQTVRHDGDRRERAGREA
jgi:hypothetical protein